MKHMKADTIPAIRAIRGNKPFCRAVALFSAVMFLLISATPAFADPTSVLGGNAVLTGMTTGTTLDNGANAAVFSSSSASAVLDWTKFNVGAGQSMTFDGASTTFFNLVDGAAGKSQIDGIINGSGNVWVINPAGIAFGAGSSVNVGGLFAAAAGNLANEEALRTGATLPEFSSFGGEISVADGASFTPQSGFSPNQVCLMGKTVTASGEFSGIDGLSLAAGSAMKVTVDEVAGGKVTVDVEDFGDAANSVVLDGLVFDGGRVEATAEGKVSAADVGIAAKESVSLVGYAGDVVLGGSVAVNSPEGEAYVSVRAAGGDIVIGQDTEIEVNGKFASVDMMAGRCSGCDPSGVSDGACSEEGIRPGAVKIGADATIAVSGTESACLTALAHGSDVTLGTGSSIDVEGGSLGLETYQSGDVVAEAGSTVKSDQGMSLSGDNIRLDGDIQSHGWISAHANESLTIGNGATVKTDGEGASVYLDAGLTEWDDNCQLVGVSGGNVTVGEGAIVAADGQYGSVGVSALKGSVDIKGELRADNAGTVSAMTGMSDSMMSGSAMGGGNVNVHATGKVVGQSVFVNAMGGKVSVAGAVGVGDGDVGRCVVTLTGEGGVASSGTIDVKTGTLEVYGGRGDINLFDQASGVVYAGDIILVAEGNVYADNPNNQIGKVTEAKAGPGKVLRIELGECQTVEIGNIVSDAAYLRSEKGTIKVVGDITAPEEVVLKTENGDIIVMENCTVTATGSGAVVRLKAGQDIVNDGKIVSDGAIDLAAGRDIGGEGMVAAASDVTATAGGSVKLTAANGLSLGDVTAKNGDVDVSTVRGDIVVNGVVQSKAESGTVLLKAATDANAVGSVIVNEDGSLTAPGKDGSVIAIAGYGKLKEEGKIDEENVVKMMSKMSSAGLLGAGEGSFVQLSERATVIAGRLIVLEGQVGVVSAGLIDAREANLEVNGHAGDIDLYAGNTGVVLANGADFKADGSVRVGNQENSIGYVGELEYGGTLDLNFGGVGGEVTKVITSDNFSTLNYAMNGTILVVGDLAAPDDVFFIAVNGNVAVVRDCHVVVGNDGYAYFGAAQSVMIDGVVDAHDIQLDGRNVIVGENARLNADMGEGLVLAGLDYSPYGFNQYEGYVDGNIQIGGEINAYKTRLGAIGDVVQGAGSRINTCEFKVNSIGNSYLRGTTSSWVADILANGDVELGNLSASKHYPKFGEDMQSSIDAASLSGDVRVLSGCTVAATREGGGEIYLTADQGSVMVDGTVRAAHEDGTGAGEVTVMAERGIQVAQGGLVSSGTTTQLLVGNNGGGGDVSIAGRVTSDDAVYVTAKNGGITVGGTGVVDGRQANWLETSGHDLRVEGEVNASDGNNGLSALIVNGAGDVVLGQDAKVVGELGVVVQTENGDLHQEGAPVISSAGGRAPVVDLEPAISGGNVMLAVNGDVGGASGGSVTVDGALLGIVSGNADVAIARGGDLVGGTPQDAAQLVGGDHGIFDIDVSQLGENSAMIVGGNLSLYTAGGIGSYTTFKAGGNASISAARFGDTSYLQAGGTLTINNVGKPAHPQIAYFESVNGREPRINNQPNDTVIFIDGRLAGGNLQIINKFGATEAFPVSTPELKSEQGIFGNPVFMHGDLDVANPMAVGNVDYMLQEIPRLTLASDFPLEVDKSVNTAGLNPKDVYRFGQHQQVAEEKPQTEQEEKKDDKASAEKSVEPKVAMR